MTIDSLPNDYMSPTTESVAFFSENANSFAQWLIRGFEQEGSSWVRSDIVAREPDAILGSLSPRADVGVNRYLLLSLAGWTAVLNDAKLGTDMGMIPSIAVRQLRCRAIRATAIEERNDKFGTTVLEVFEPEADPPLRCRRTISAANDGGIWRFSEFGEPFPFEETSTYRHRKIQERFTPDLLHRYLKELSISLFVTKSLAGYSPMLVTRRS